MHLKSLTLRGFKSFASATTLVFEPGVTCVVGPNGSGKSNVVDAISWVMGEQGAKSLRGGKMEDVIFAGTSSRAPLGRAEVSLTIDNSDGALPIDYAEVTITRTMFRNGGSDYQINGEPCRLLDVQELLSDSGIGREMHVIVGQGRLDAVLHASPDDRRGFIEEAAGVLKHRKRKEKALRKLDAMAANLTRLTDLTSELRRQLKPLGRQAELARRAQVIQSDLRDARLRLLADEVATLSAALAKEEADEAALRQAQAEVDTALREAREQERALEAEVAEQAPREGQVQDTYVALVGHRERFAALAGLAAERMRNAPAQEESVSGPDPDELDAQAETARREVAGRLAEVEQCRSALSDAQRRLAELRAQLDAAERAMAAERTAAADYAAETERIRRALAAAVSRQETREVETSRLQAAHHEAVERGERAAREYQELESRISGMDVGERGLDARHDRATTALADAEQEVEHAEEAFAAATHKKAALTARVEALGLGLKGHDGSSALLAADAQLDGVLGTVASIVQVEPGFEVAVGAALGAMAEAVALRDLRSATSAIDYLSHHERGRAHMLLDGAEPQPEQWPDLPSGAVYAIDVVHSQRLRGALTRLLRKVVVVADLSAAAELVERLDVVAVTKDGDVIGRGWAMGGRSESILEVKAALAEAEHELEAAEHEVQRCGFAVAGAKERQSEAVAEVDAVLEQLHESDAAMSAIAEELGSLGSAVRAARGESERIAAALEAARVASDDDAAAVTELRAQLAHREQHDQPSTAQIETEAVPRLREELDLARTLETEAQLAARTAEERHSATAARVRELERSADELRQRQRAQQAERLRRRREAAVAQEVAVVVRRLQPVVEDAVRRCQAQRQELETRRAARDAQLRELRERIRQLLAEAERLNDTVHRDEMAKAAQQMRIDQAMEKALAEYGIESGVLVQEYGPDQPVPSTAVPVADSEDAAPETPAARAFDREEQEARAAKAERELQALGRVNPLALEEFDAMQERQAFLTAQLEDLKQGRDDLLGIIAEVDDRVREVFAQAYADVAAQFEEVFSRLFPGGEGKLVLTDPDDMLHSGVEVEARPAGKKIKRLSLLSGGERSLTAVAFLVALFKARPSPFYLLDEVEAALDDANLGRLIGLVAELRETSQLLIITHQKRTMEVADALYGVTMRDGVTSVISQRLREAV